VVTGWKNDCVHFVAEWRFASVFAFDGRRRSASAHKTSTGADLAIWSPDGKTIAFTSGVYPECKDDECNKKKDEEKDKIK